ncbi:MAG: hypothetical protein ACI379_02540, partial [Nocardioides sp.]|uniref:hypothetical protein n=1 Tax=Nocardioides sp. TaxID=35761 RepID=UPI003EFE8AB7
MSAADVKPHLERVIKQLIKRDMAWHGFLEAGDNGFLQSPAVETNPGDPPGMVPPPGGPTGTYLIASGWQGYCGRSEVNPATDVYAHWREEITSLFSEWWSIPSQSEVEGVARSLREPLGYTALEPGAEGDYRMEFDENAPLISAFENGGPTLALLQGQAMNAFRTQYWGHLQRVTVRYHLAVRMLTVLVIAEAELWKNAWKDLAQLADDAAYALENKESVSSPFDTIATIAKVAGMFPGPQKGA